MEYLKTNKLQSDFILKNQKPENGKMFSQLKKIIDFVMEHSRINGLRDYSDQLNEVINLFRNDKNTIPKFEHVLVDEFQDVNSIQMELIRLLEPENLFFVGDPRQSIFGWRGSRIDYILSFEKENKDAEILYLTKNYRSSKKIVEFMNAISSEFSLPNLSSTRNDTGEVRILEFENPESEIAFIVESIRNDYEKFLDTFILARTNRQIEEISKSLSIRGIQHKIKTDEGTRGSGKLTLATIHAIKGLEADAVFIVGADDKNLPCRVPESPITEIIREEYDRFSEEKRLFYVAVSRAKKRLTLTFSGKPSYFITDELMSIANRQA
ncbi:hypothetical protein D6829_02845 [Candidatus Pacearchaeota archaeon]|nr:MAG: hypothetical protein D6829_02845 [Candidatus Pacearchaeota archaeon]